MTDTSLSYRSGALIVFAASVAGLVLALYAYFTPLTGVNGTLGALLLIAACVILAIAALILPSIGARGGRNVLRVLIVLGLIGAGVAALLLHQWWAALAMAVGLIGLIIDATRPARAARPSRKV